MGAGIASVLEPSLAGKAGAAIRPARAGVAARNPEDGRHLLPEALDGRDARRPAIARGGGDGAAVSRCASGIAAAATLGGAERRGRPVSLGGAIADGVKYVNGMMRVNLFG